MPKKSKKSVASKDRFLRKADSFRPGPKLPGTTGSGSDDESVFNDNASMISNASSGSAYYKEEGVGEEAVDELTKEEEFEEKLRDAIDMASQKSANGRSAALQALCSAFQKKYIPDFVEDRRLTFTDVIERALKKGRGAEQVHAANLSVLLCLQLGPTPDSDEVYRALKPIYLAIMHDPTGNLRVRAAAATAVGSTCFLAGGELDECLQIMDETEKIFSQSYKKSGQTNAKQTEDLFALHTAALDVWALLLTLLPPSKGAAFCKSHLERLGDLLDCSDVDLRISAGEAIGILYELAGDAEQDDVSGSIEDDLIDKLQALAKDGHKYRSKKDRKEQKSSFRDILQLIEEGEIYFEKIKINRKESIQICSFSEKKQYDELCKALSSGTSIHLTSNEMVRDIFQLGAPLSEDRMREKGPSKWERLHVSKLREKERFKHRNRDKRSVVL